MQLIDDTHLVTEGTYAEMQDAGWHAMRPYADCILQQLPCEITNAKGLTCGLVIMRRAECYVAMYAGSALSAEGVSLADCLGKLWVITKKG